MTSDELIAKRKAAEAFCAEHIVECAKELIEWQDTGLLRSGRMRELGAMCTEYMGNHDGLHGAERMVERRACEMAAAVAGQDARGTALLYTCIDKGGTYEHIGVAEGAGYTSGSLVHVYRNQATGGLFYRTPADFDARMERIDAIPSPVVDDAGREGRDAARLRKVLIDVRHALQFANDTPVGAIGDTIWMIDEPETLFDFIDAVLAAQDSKDGGKHG